MHNVSRVIVVDHISNVVRKHRLLDDESAKRLPAVYHVSYSLHANVISCSITRSAHQCWHKSSSELNFYLRIVL